MKLRLYQAETLKKVNSILYKYRVCYLAGEVRTGKTITALYAASPYNRILFVTKKKAISSIESDIANCNIDINVTVINYEQLHRINFTPDFIIYDEAHCLGAFPKPSKRTVFARNKFAGITTLFLSGTPTPESFSQLYHQFWVTGSLSPWAKNPSFYDWAKTFVNIQIKPIRMGLTIRDYKSTKPEVVTMFDNYKVTMTQQGAGFNGNVVEKIHTLKLPDKCRELIRSLRKDKLSIRFRLVGDSGSKLMQQIHQISSGTYIESYDEDNSILNRNRFVISTFKIDYIKKTFKGKIAIFYVYIAEGDLLKKHFTNWTDEPEEFNSSDKIFICQIQSGKEGVNLKSADHLIFYNISFSAVAYWQGRARSQSRSGGDKLVHWIFSDVGIEPRIYKVVTGKKNFTKRHFDERELTSI